VDEEGYGDDVVESIGYEEDTICDVSIGCEES